MGESKYMNSSNNGYWLEGTPLTAKTNAENKSFEQIKNVIERYKEALKCNSETSTENIVFDKSTKFDNIDFDLPKIEKYYDIYNSKRFSKKIQNWQGIVIDINNKSFKSKLIDLTSGGTYEIGEFDFDDVSPDDLPLLSIGSIFYWSVGHYMENGQSVKRSDIRFQRLITLNEDDIEIVKSKIEFKYSNLKEKKLGE
jgi:hypothetical protein